MSLQAVDSNIYTYEYFQQEDVCRLCWNKHAEREIISKNTDDIPCFKNHVIDKILYCLNIDVTELSHPSKACANCFEVLDKFYEFKVFCKETDKRLREILAGKSNNNVDNIDEGSCAVKLEKNDQKHEIENSAYFDTFFNDLPNSDGFLESDTLPKHVKDKKTKIKSKYKPIRTPTYCNICRVDYETEDCFTEHNSSCHGIEDGGFYKCFGCEKRFKSRKTRLGHEINFCKGLKDGYQCSICNRYLPKRRIYENHMRDHRDNVQVELPDDIFKCLKCYKLFNTKTSLKKHMEVHDLEKKNFVCESCGRMFSRQDYLYKHKLTHTGIKQHICPHCGFRTTQKSSLTVHIRKHTGERPYVCDVCPQRCVSSSNLRAHRRRHLGVKNYECTICCKKFGYKISLEEHVASTHERAHTHSCPQCGAAYTRPRGLRRHLLTKHPKTKIQHVTEATTNLYLKVATEDQLDDDKVDGMKDVQVVKRPEFSSKTQDAVFIV